MKPIIVSHQIILTAPDLSDAPALFQLRTDPDVNRYIQRVLPESIQDTEQFIKARIAATDAYYFIIRSLPENVLAGTICLWNINRENTYAEIGYELLPAFQGKGLMTKAMDAILAFAFTEAGIKTIEAFTHLDNLPSRKLLEKSGFSLVPGKTDPDNEKVILYRLAKPVS